jgi:hypothetical protein
MKNKVTLNIGIILLSFVISLVLFCGVFLFFWDGLYYIETKTYNNVKYEIVRDIEGPYFIAKTTQPNYNQIKGGSFFYSQNPVETKDILNIEGVYEVDGLRFVSSYGLLPQDFYNIKSCYPDKKMTYVRNIADKGDNKTYEICEEIKLTETNTLEFNQCKFVE